MTEIAGVDFPSNTALRLNEMSPSQARFDIVDFHNHHIPARFEQTAVRAAPASQRGRWEALVRAVARVLGPIAE